MGLSGYDQTACLAEAHWFAAEDHSRYQDTRRHLNEERKRAEKANKHKRQLANEQAKQREKLWNFYTRKTKAIPRHKSKN